jgi:hypothetical protein
MRHFILREATIATGFDESGKRVAVTIPARAKITAVDIVPLEPTKDHAKQINVIWDGRSLTMFLADLQHRGERLRSGIQ